MNIVEFSLIKENIIINGYLNTDTVNDDEPELEYYNNSFQANYYYPTNPYSTYTDNWIIFEGLKTQHIADDLFIDIIYENKDEKRKLVNRDGYKILINPME